jgi:hypothetical protein
MTDVDETLDKAAGADVEETADKLGKLSLSGKYFS